MSKLLLIEDDAKVRQWVADSLQAQGFVIDAAADGSEGLYLAANYAYDLLIVDWNLPGIQGIDIVKELRKSGNWLRVLMLTAHKDLADKEEAFNSGVDDYLCKPFENTELILRIKALLRRPGIQNASVINASQLELHLATRRVICAGSEVKLNPTEYSLLEFFMKHQEHVFTAEYLLHHCWKSMSESTENAVRFHITGLRRKIDHGGISGSYIETVYGVGYRFVGDGSGKKHGKSSA